jgi:hypothetical protein
MSLFLIIFSIIIFTIGFNQFLYSLRNFRQINHMKKTEKNLQKYGITPSSSVMSQGTAIDKKVNKLVETEMIPLSWYIKLMKKS